MSLISVITLDASLAQVQATTDAPLSGTQQFQISRRFDFSYDQGWLAPVFPPTANTAPNTYRLNMQDANGRPARGPWWVRIFDSAGPEGTPLPVYVDVNAVSIYNIAGRALRDLLLGEKPMIDLFLAAVDDKFALQSVRYTRAWEIKQETPAMVVSPLSIMQRYEGPGELYIEMRYGLTGVVRMTDPVYEAEVISQLAYAVTTILNQQAYSAYGLPNGIELTGGRTEDTIFGEASLGNIWAAQVDMEWSWEYLQITG